MLTYTLISTDGEARLIEYVCTGRMAPATIGKPLKSIVLSTYPVINGVPITTSYIHHEHTAHRAPMILLNGAYMATAEWKALAVLWERRRSEVISKYVKDKAPYLTLLHMMCDATKKYYSDQNVEPDGYRFRDPLVVLSGGAPCAPEAEYFFTPIGFAGWAVLDRLINRLQRHIGPSLAGLPNIEAPTNEMALVGTMTAEMLRELLGSETGEVMRRVHELARTSEAVDVVNYIDWWCAQKAQAHYAGSLRIPSTFNNVTSKRVYPNGVNTYYDVYLQHQGWDSLCLEALDDNEDE